LMGSPDSDSHADDDEKPQHKVRITKPFYLGVYEVTRGEYAKLTGTKWNSFPEIDVPGVDTSRFAIGAIDWDGAMEFCNKLSAEERKTYRLPTEAEWEYACRAGTTTRYSFGDDVARLREYAWSLKDSERSIHTYSLSPTGQGKPNAWGLYDVHGNVQEWCSDRYAKDCYRQSPTNDPKGPIASEFRVMRGGSSDDPEFLRCAFRNFGLQALCEAGFRVVRTLTP